MAPRVQRRTRYGAESTAVTIPKPCSLLDAWTSFVARVNLYTSKIKGRRTIKAYPKRGIHASLKRCTSLHFGLKIGEGLFNPFGQLGVQPRFERLEKHGGEVQVQACVP